MTVPDKNPPWKANAADCVTTMIPNPNVPSPGLPNVQPQQFPNKWSRSADGKMRMDFANMSVIQDPVNQRTIMLDHLKKEFQITPLDPHAPALPGMPGGLPAMPAPPANAVHAVDLGKALIEGHEVTGKRYTFPAADGAIPTVSEVWTSTSLHMPVLTKTTGSFGEQIQHCRYTKPEAPATTFQVPPDYTQIHPPAAPAAPQMPQVPHLG